MGRVVGTTNVDFAAGARIVFGSADIRGVRTIDEAREDLTAWQSRDSARSTGV